MRPHLPYRQPVLTIRTSQRAAGFSLIELSIVLVLIGLIVGGILTGKQLLRAGEIRSVVGDLEKFRSAYTQFKTQYNGMPGDLADATQYWGVDTTATCPGGTRVPKKETCDGDGNNLINNTESFRAWQQLADATLIEGFYTGVAGSGGTSEVEGGTNAPAGKISLTTYQLYSVGAITANSSSRYYDGYYRAIVLFGKKRTADYPFNAALTPGEALQIDEKIDDRLPASGSIVAMKSGENPGCTTSDTSSTAKYNATSETIACALISVFETE